MQDKNIHYSTQQAEHQIFTWINSLDLSNLDERKSSKEIDNCNLKIE